MTSRATTSPPTLPSLADLQALWKSLAHRFFDDRLPPIGIEWSSRLTASTGLFVSQVGPRSRWVSPAYRQGEGRVIRLSAPLLADQSEEELVRTLAHEMIHQWEFDVRKRRPSHGREFRIMMDRMNQEGMRITVHHSLGNAVESYNRYAWRCLACGMDYVRQRRTIVPSRHVCSRCRGKLVEIFFDVKKNQRSEGGREFTKDICPTSYSRPVQLEFNF